LPAVSTRVTAPSQDGDRIFDAVWKDGRPGAIKSTKLPERAYSVDAVSAADKPKQRAPASASNIDPALDKRVAAAESAGASDASIDVVVTFHEEIDIPRFPSPVERQARDSSTNQAAKLDSDQLVRDVQSARERSQARLADELASSYGAKVLEKFWLINGLHVELPVSQVRALAKRGDVQYIEQDQKEIPPPTSNSVDARSDMVTDPYFNLNLTSGWIGLLDTGVRSTHTLLSHAAWLRDCVNGGSDCNTGALNTDDDCWNHGTSSMSELTANTNLGDANRGITGISVDSFKVYTCSGLSAAASVRGFQAAVAALDRVIVAEIQDTGGENGSIASAADAAFSAGAVVVAANGNFGSGASTVRSPGNARRAIGVGAEDVNSLLLQSYSGRGPTADGRTKPDILGPTNVNAASNASSTALQLFTGTSSATPNAAGAAALLRNFVRGSTFEIDPGQINALLINAGRQTIGSAYDQDNGAGFISLPVNGHIWWGWVTAATTSGSVVDVPIGVSGSGGRALTVTIWWPEAIGGSHNDVDLNVLRPDGSYAAGSVSIASVFEKTQVPSGSLSDGTWIVRIRSYNVRSSQRVYYAVNFQ
jgi:hypothetical protein